MRALCRHRVVGKRKVSENQFLILKELKTGLEKQVVKKQTGRQAVAR